MNLVERCNKIAELFDELTSTSSRVEKQLLVRQFKDENKNLVDDLDFCFEVLAGKHKLGYTYSEPKFENKAAGVLDLTIKEFYKDMLMNCPASLEGIELAKNLTPSACSGFIWMLANRLFKLGYSNKDNMIKDYSPMLAKKYQDTFKSQYYYIQEKLDGNRCIAYKDFEGDGRWHFMSRSGKELKVTFDMSWADKHFTDRGYEMPIFDGEIMTLEHAGSRDFNRTSGAINGKYTDKSGLHYFIYDVVNPNLEYKWRKEILDAIEDTGEDCQILPVIDKIFVNADHNDNYDLDKILDYITDKGGEGVMLRDPDGFYLCGKRSDGLLKYKKTQTMDLRIIDWNWGTPGGKYENAIGSFYCESDDRKIRVNVAGLPDSIHFDDPARYMGRIMEVAYFDLSAGKDNDYMSLRFPRLKRFRDDKNETSIY